MPRRLPLVARLLAGAGLLLAGCAAAAPAGQSVGAFAVPLLDGPVVRSHELQGRVVVVNFFASWCVPCRGEAPDLQQPWGQYRDRDVLFLGGDMRNDDQELARQFVR